MTNGHVVVIGAGLAGLQTAIRCAEAGARVTVLESRPWMGGATWSRKHRGLGFEIDNGQHVFMRCCEEYLAFLERLGVRDRVEIQDRLSVPVARPGAGLDWIRRHRLPAPIHLASSLLGYRPLSLAARIRAGRTARAVASLDPMSAELDRGSIGAWLEGRGETELAIDQFWDVLVRSTLNLRCADASMALATKVLRTGFLDRADGADLGWSKVPLAQLHADPADRLLRRLGAEVHAKTRVDRIEPARDARGPAVWSDGERIEADAVVMAVPNDAAAGLLAPIDGRRARRIASLGRSAIVNLHVVFDRPVLDLPFVAGIGSRLQWVFDRTASSGVTEGQYLTVSLSDADEYLGLGMAALRRLFVPEFHALLPRSRAARVLKFAVTNEPAATFRQAPGTKADRLRPGILGDGLYVAGAWTDTGWPATMEGAVRSGRLAAFDVIGDLSRLRDVGARRDRAASKTTVAA